MLEIVILRGENHAVFYFINQQLTINGQKYSQMTPTVCEQFKMSLSRRLSLGYSPKKEHFLYKKNRQQKKVAKMFSHIIII